MTELLRACIESGQVDAQQIEAHRAAGGIAPRRPPPPWPMTEADLRHLEDVNAPIDDDERRQAAAEIRRLQADLRTAKTAIPASAVLQIAKYHLWPADEDGPEGYEVFDTDVDCDDCTPVLILRADAVEVF